jgi:hypothetical protein
MQCLAQDATEVVELQEEVTQVQAAAIMVKARATQAEGMAQEKTALLVTAHSEVVEATQRVSILGDKFVATRWARVAAEGKVSSLAAKVAMGEQRWEAAKEQRERLVHELTLLSLMGSKLCITITGTPPLAPCVRGCALWQPSTLKLPHGYSRSRQRCLWPLSPSSCAGPLMLPKRVL